MSGEEATITVAALLEAGGQQGGGATVIFSHPVEGGEESEEEEDDQDGRMRSELMSLGVEPEAQPALEPNYQEETPDEIECQLIQKNVLINGIVQTLDFIMCNQCTRLFRTENLLWNHIKVKHKRRIYRRTPVLPPRFLPAVRPQRTGELEPGELAIHTLPFAVGQDFEEERGESSGGQMEIYVNPEVFVNDDENSENAEYMAQNQVDSVQARSQFQTGVAETQRNRDNVYIIGVENNTWNRIPEEEEENHTCPLCHRVSFPTKRQYDNHMKKAHRMGSVECNECGKSVLDLKRHREVSHRKFRVFECTHCDDKFCSQEDLLRHLRNVEAKNRVENLDGKTQPTNQASLDPDDPDEAEDGAREDSAVVEFVKELESKIFVCSDCGLRTPSRMTYIQHVLNGCVMDQAANGDRREKKKRKQKVVEHVLVDQGDGKRRRVELSYGTLREKEDEKAEEHPHHHHLLQQ